MIFFFNANGDLLKGKPDTVYQGSSNAGTIYAVAPLNPGLIADIYFTLPNGDEAGPYLLTNGGTVIEGKELPDGYALWFINLNSNLTQFAGDLTAQIGFYATEDMTAETADGVAQKVPVITTQAFNIVISRGVARTLPAEPTNDVYEQIVNTLTLLSQDISKISGIYPPASIKDIGEAAVTYNTTDGVVLKTTEQWMGTDGETFDIETERKFPIKGGKDIVIDVSADGKFVVVKNATTPIPESEKGKANGVATLDSGGLIPTSQLPTYVDDVIDGYIVGSTPFAADWLSKTPNGAPLTPERDKIYIVVSEGEYINIEYRWSGTVYAELGKTTPLSNTTGQSTEVGMTQKAITDELAKKQDTLAIYTINTAKEVTIPADDLAKIKADPNAVIVEIDSTRPSVETRFYKKGIDFIGGTVFVSIYTVVGAEVAEGCSIAYRSLNTTTGVLTARHETNATSLAEVRQEIEGKYLPKPSGNPTEDSLVKVSSVGTSSWIAISDIKVPIIEIPSASTGITQEQANIIINNKDVTILYGTTQKIIYRKFTEYELTTTHLAYFVQFGGANPDAAQKIKQLVLTVDLNNLTVSRVELEIPRVSFITGTDEDENDVVLQTKFAKAVFDTPAVKANPTLKGTEEELTALQVGLTKYKVPSGSGSGAGIDTLTDVNLTASGTTVAYDIASGVTVNSNGKFTYEGGEKDATTKVNVPIVAGKGIVIAKVADKEQVEAKVDINEAVRGGYNRTIEIGSDTLVNKIESIAIGSRSKVTGSTSVALGAACDVRNDFAIAVGFNARAHADSAIVIGNSAYSNKSIGIAIGHSAQILKGSSPESAIAIGYSVKVSEGNDIGLGYNININTNNCVVMGRYNESTVATDRFVLADGTSASAKHNYFKITQETAGDVTKYTAYLNDKKLLSEDEGLSKPSGNPTVDSVVKVSSTGTTSYLEIDTTATSASTNLITSGAVAAVEYSLSQSIAGCATEPDVSTFPENDDAFFMGEKTSHASKWLPKKQMTLKSHKIHFEAFDSGSTVGQYDDAFISVLCYTETHFTVDTLTTFMLATGQSYPVCSPSYGMVGYVRVSNAAGEITWEDKEGNNIALAGINENSYVVTDIQSFFPFE